LESVLIWDHKASMISNLAISTDLFLRQVITVQSTNYVVHGVWW